MLLPLLGRMEFKNMHTADSMRNTSPDSEEIHVAQFGWGVLPHGGDVSPAGLRTVTILCVEMYSLQREAFGASLSAFFKLDVFPNGRETETVYHIISCPKTNHALKKPNRGLFK